VTIDADDRNGHLRIRIDVISSQRDYASWSGKRTSEGVPFTIADFGQGLPRRTSKKSFIAFIQLRATVWAWGWQSAVRSSSHTAAVDQRKHRIELDPLRLLRPEIDQPDAIGNGRKRRSTSSAKPRSPSLLELQYWAWRRRPPPTHCGHRELARRSIAGR
jgi:hypothetical protein